MPANMSRLSQVCGMSTRKSLNRPRLGVTNAFQRIQLDEMRLNKSQTNGFMGPATTVHVRGSNGRYGQEKIFVKDCDVKHLIWQCLRHNPDWKPSKWAKRELRNHPMMQGRGQKTAKGLLG